MSRDEMIEFIVLSLTPPLIRCSDGVVRRMRRLLNPTATQRRLRNIDRAIKRRSR